MGLKFCEICGSLLKGGKCNCKEETKEKTYKKSIISYVSNTLNEHLSIIEDLEYLKEKIYKVKLSFKPLYKAQDTRIIFNKKHSSDRYYPINNTIEFGTKYLKHQTEKIKRKCLVHEFIHACGVNHNRFSRAKYNYYSSLGQDKLSEKVMKLIGWEPPTNEEYLEYIKLKNEEIKSKKPNYENSKYRVYCEKCGREWFRKRKSKATENPDKFVCPCGKKGLEVEEL